MGVEAMASHTATAACRASLTGAAACMASLTAVAACMASLTAAISVAALEGRQCMEGMDTRMYHPTEEAISTVGIASLIIYAVAMMAMAAMVAPMVASMVMVVVTIRVAEF